MNGSLRLAAIVAAPLMVFGVGCQEQQRPLVVVTSGGTFERALERHFYQPFTIRTAIRIAPVGASLGSQWARLAAMRQARSIEWDVVTAFPEDLISRYQELLEPIDCARIPIAKETQLPNTCTPHGVLRSIGAGVLTWNTTQFKGKEPTNWFDFWDLKTFPGPRTLPSTPSAHPWLLIVALLADGVPQKQLFPLDVERALRKLEEIKPHVSVWWSTGEQSQAALRDGDAVMGLLWVSRVVPSIAQGVPLRLSYEQSIQNITYWGIVRDTPNRDAAYRFLNFFLHNPKEHAAFTEDVGVATPSAAVREYLSEAEWGSMPTNPENWSKTIELDAKWIADNQEMISRRVMDLLSK